MPAATAAQVAKHSAASVEHYTPADVIARARRTMGEIDLDPASCAQANSELVRAITYYDERVDGLSRPWHGRVWLNPPGGRLGPDLKPVKFAGMSSAKVWWRKLVREVDSGRVSQACFLGFNMEILQSTQAYGKDYPWPGADLAVGDFPVCIPSKRLAFLYVEGGSGRLKVGGGPTHANVVAYLGRNVTAFAREFASLGTVLYGASGAR